MGNDEKESDKQKKIEIIIKEEHIRKIFNAYSTIKNFLIKYIYRNENISINNNGINVYLVSTKSIPNLINILKQQFKEEIKDESELMKIEEKLRTEFQDYEIEKNIVIYESYQDCLELIDNEESNEFIIAEENFFTNLDINSSNYRGREVKIVKINKAEKKLTIQFPSSEKILVAKEKQKGYFQFCDLDSVVENKICRIQSIVYCLLNIKSLNDYLINNKINKENKISLIFQNILLSKRNKNNNFDFSDLIETIFEYNIDNSNNIIEIIYNQLHFELKDKKEEIFSRIIEQDKNNPDPVIEVLNSCNEFEKKGKSIISDNFYFQDITTYKCGTCNKILLYESTLKNSFLFPLNEIMNFTKNSSELNIFNCFDYLTRTKKSNIKCTNCDNQAYTYYKIDSTKDILTFVLDRGTDFTNEIKFNLAYNIDISKYFFNQDNKQSYELIGFCSFYKDEKICFSFFKNYENNQWYQYNGSDIKICPNLENVGAPFLLLYKKRC